jgi:hypothetical protein
MSEQELAIILSILGGGTITAIINVFANKKKNHTDIVNTNVDASLKLRDKAISSLATTEEKLDRCQKLLDEARIELLIYKSYVIVLCNLLEENNIDYESFEEYKNKKKKDFS